MCVSTEEETGLYGFFRLETHMDSPDGKAPDTLRNPERIHTLLIFKRACVNSFSTLFVLASLSDIWEE
jgi:hypothetical protein